MSTREPRFSIRVFACDVGASVWLLDIGGFTVLFDAWLDDPYVSGSPGFFTGRRVEAMHVPLDRMPTIDAVVISSAEQDHAHPRSLAKLRRTIWIAGPPEVAAMARQLGFTRVVGLRPAEQARICMDEVSLLALQGYGRNTAFVLRENGSGERVLMAPHGVNARWLAKHENHAFGGEFARDEHGRYVETLVVGVHTTLLRPPRVPERWLGDWATIVPDPDESVALALKLKPHRVLFGHCTREHEEGFAVRHLLKYPTAQDDLGHAQRVFEQRGGGVRVVGLPAPGRWV